MRTTTIFAALAVLLVATVAGPARGQGRADSPSSILGHANPELARCVSARGLVKVLLTLDLDRQSRVHRVGIESETALSKGSKRCLEKVAMGLSFAPDVAGM